MFSLDINFLKDRDSAQGAGQAKVEKKPLKIEMGEMVPLIGGVVVLVVLPALAGIWLVTVNTQKAQIQRDIQEIEGKIKDLDAKTKKLNELETKITQAQKETTALISVFDLIKPWSAILQDISDRTPARVRIDSIQQNQSSLLRIMGVAGSYDDVNDFILVLKQSNFLDGNEIKLQNAALRDNNTALKYEIPDGEIKVKVELPQVVSYTIQAQLNDQPASSILTELKRKGAVGLVHRIETLKKKGLIE